MIRTVSRRLVLALTFLTLTAFSVRGNAQSTTTPPSDSSNPSVITGTNPEPQDDTIVEILYLLFFA